MNITIRDLHTNEEYLEIIELQKIIWRLNNYNDCIPNHIYMAVSEIGGVVIGAFIEQKMVGFLMVLVGCTDKKGVHHHSHILGIHPDFVHYNIGYRLKKAHYEKSKKDIKLVTWTYDPLQGPNGNLNITKLGGIVRTYKINYYGEVMGESDLVSGLPSDRFWVEWFLQSNHVKEKIEGLAQNKINFEDYQLLNRVKIENDLQKMNGYSKPESNRVAIEIPLDFQQLFDQDKKLGNEWRLQIRDIFQECFEKGYTVVDFLHHQNKGNFYLLEKDFWIK